MSDNNLPAIKKINSNNQTMNHDENENIKVIKSISRESNEIILTAITENKVVILDYKDLKINSNYYLLNNLKIEPTLLYKLNISYKNIVKTLNKKLMSRLTDGRYILDYKDSINLDNIIGLACIAMNESEENNKRLRMRNTVLEIKCENYQSVVEECIRLKYKLNEIIINLCLALGRNGNDKEDIMHLTNLCAALYARENDYHYIEMENDNLKFALEKQLIYIRKITLNNYNEILNKIDKINEELITKNLKISHLMKDVNMYSINAVNEKHNDSIQLVGDLLSPFSNESINENIDNSFDKFKNNNELHEGKLLIAEQINQLEESNNVNAENYQLSDLIDMFMRSIFDKTERLERINEHVTRSIEDKNQQFIKEITDQNQQLLKEIDDQKEWQKHLENENEKLNSEIDEYKRLQNILMNKDNEHVDLKKDFLNIQCMYDDLRKEDTRLKIMLSEYQRKLTEKEIKCVDSDHLIKTLRANLIEQTQQFEQANSMHINEREKCQSIKSKMEQMVEEFTVQLHRKTSNILIIQDECRSLKDCIGSAEAEIEYLKQNIITLEYALYEKNKTIQNISEKQIKQQNSSISSLQFNEQLHILSKLEQSMDILLEDWSISKKKIMNYEKVLNIMQNANQKQFTKRNYWLANHKNIKDIKCQTLPDKYLFKEKEIIILRHQQEIECLKNYYNLKITNLTNIEFRLKTKIKILDESLKLKSSHLIMTERIASLQQKESFNTVQYLTHISNNQTIKLNSMKNKIEETNNVEHLMNSTKNIINRRKIQIHCLIDYVQKLKTENIAIKKLCEIRNERIKYLEIHHSACTNHI